MNDTTVVYKDSTGQPLEYQFKVGNKPLDITGATVKFMMRQAFTSAVKVDQFASATSATKGHVAYSWQPQDVDTQGEYKAWWELDFSGRIIESEELDLVVAEHAPGIRTGTGSVYRTSMSYLPSTWIALETSKGYGDSLLQERCEYVKLRILGETIAVEDESSLDLRVLHFIAKNVAVQLIPTGIDYWLDQKIKVQIETGGASQEIYDYENRAKSLLDLIDKLLADIENEREEIEDILGIYKTVRSTSTAAYAEGQDEGFVTPSPVLNFRNYNWPSKDRPYTNGW